jgi:hypothetical protein
MSDALSFAEIDAQYVELLPARTTLQAGQAGSGDSGGGSALVIFNFSANNYGDLSSESGGVPTV